MSKLQEQLSRLGLSADEIAEALSGLHLKPLKDRACSRCEWWLYQGPLKDSGSVSGECRLSNRFHRRFANDWCSHFTSKEADLDVAAEAPQG